MKSIIVGFLFITLIYYSSQSTPANSEGSPSTPPVIEERLRLSRVVNEFGHNLMLKMMKLNPNNNIVISPSGIAGLLAMTLLGSAGSTYDELAKVLGFSQDILLNRRNHEVFGKLLQDLNETPQQDMNNVTENTDLGDNVTTTEKSENNIIDEVKNFDVKTTNVTSDLDDLVTQTLYADAIVVDSNVRIRDVYHDYLERVYKGEAFNTNFGDTMKSQQLINGWVREHTLGKIDEFIKEPLPAATKVVLLSALYFSGQWARPFAPEYTTKMPFHGPTGDIKAEQMLNFGQFNYTFISQLGMHMISFPYNDSSTKMYVMKPFHHNKLTLTQLMESLDYAAIENITDSMKQHDCVVRFPKMNLKTKANLKDSLKALGIESMFSSDANFALLAVTNPMINKSGDGELVSRIYTGDEESKRLKDVINGLPNPGMFVSSVMHDVQMTINEYGTVAVAATSGFLSRTAKMFHADSPFYMFIRNERTKLVTFSAVIYDPTVA